MRTIINFQIITNDNFLENSNDSIQIRIRIKIGIEVEITIVGFIHNLSSPIHLFEFVNLSGLSLTVRQ